MPFKLTSSSSTHAVFENKDNDFPRRLEYRLRKKNKLNVTVSDGAKRSVVTPFSKVEPPAAKNKAYTIHCTGAAGRADSEINVVRRGPVKRGR